MRLRIVSYNIHKGVGADRAYSLDRIVSVLRQYDPDVLTLQEVMRFDPDVRRQHQVEVLGDALGLDHTVAGWNVPRRNGIYGNATLSRLPIEGSENICLRWRFKKQRNALYTRVALPGAPLHLFNVHLGLAHFERVRQMRRLVEHSDVRAAADDPTVIVGDTNDWRDGLYPGVLEPTGFVRATRRRFDRHHRTYPSWCPLGPLDQAYARGALRMVDTYPARTRAARWASDHLPMIVDLEV